MALICLISFANVVVRYATNISFAFTEEYSVVLLVIMTFVGASLAFAADRHIRILVLVNRLPPRWQSCCAGLSLAAATVVLGLIVFYGGRLAYEQWEFGETSPGLGHPAWVYTVWLPVLALLMMVRLWQRAVTAIANRR
ncbi:MAG: TRAP transporter small permease [Rhodospirillales bacterium]|nr:TRAP transporter small permease [Rhodospirillales bacterium]